AYLNERLRDLPHTLVARSNTTEDRTRSRNGNRPPCRVSSLWTQSIHSTTLPGLGASLNGVLECLHLLPGAPLVVATLFSGMAPPRPASQRPHTLPAVLALLPAIRGKAGGPSMRQLWRTSHIFRFVVANLLLIGAGALTIYSTTAFLWILAFL